MKKALVLGLVVVVGGIYFYPFAPGTGLYKIQSGLKTIGKSEAGYRRELAQKQEALKGYEDMIEQITTGFENAAANAPFCPQTGQQIEIKMDNDPRPELREKCAVLRLEIQNIEKKLIK